MGDLRGPKLSKAKVGTLTLTMPCQRSFCAQVAVMQIDILLRSVVTSIAWRDWSCMSWTGPLRARPSRWERKAHEGDATHPTRWSFLRLASAVSIAKSRGLQRDSVFVTLVQRLVLSSI